MKLREIIDFQVTCVLLELRTKFNMGQFKQLQDINQMVDYASKTLPLLGKGSSRIVFAVSNRYVLKLAIPEAVEKGIGQNQSEARIFAGSGSKPVIAAVYAADPQYRWIMSEIARPMTGTQEFQQLTGMPWDAFESYIRNSKDINKVMQDDIKEYENAIKTNQRKITASKNNPQAQQAFTKRLKSAEAKLKLVYTVGNSPVFKGSLGLIQQGVMPGDIWEVDHWGKTADGRIILIDYGFTRDIIHLYKAAATVK